MSKIDDINRKVSEQFIPYLAETLVTHYMLEDYKKRKRASLSPNSPLRTDYWKNEGETDVQYWDRVRHEIDLKRRRA